MSRKIGSFQKPANFSIRLEETASGWQGVQAWSSQSYAVSEAQRAEREYNIPFTVIRDDVSMDFPTFRVFTQYRPGSRNGE